jgi:hypothetical protein
MRQWLKENARSVGWCLGLIAFAAIAVFISQGSAFQQFAVGLLAASLSLAVALVAFELLWWIGTQVAEALGQSDHPQSK